MIVVTLVAIIPVRKYVRSLRCRQPVLSVIDDPAQLDDPEFVSGADAELQMRAEEPVLGVVIGGEARPYSLWQLDAHEIVNDEIAGSAIAATW